MTATAVEAEPGLPTSAPQPTSSTSWVWSPWLMMTLAAVSFAYGLTTIHGAAPSQWGLFAVVSPLYGLSFLLAAAAFALGVRQHNLRAAVVAVVLIVIVGRLPSAVATDMPMYSWTYKHLGVVDYLRHAHELARDVDVYNGWPGLFGLTAWFADLTGISPVTIAHWWAPLSNLVFTVFIYSLGRAWGLKQFPAITAVFIVAAYSWVAQDYYSPQSAALFFTMGILILIGLSRDRPVGMWLTIAMFAALTITHQLTPYWLLLVIAGLAVTRKVKPWWIVIPLAIILGAFLLYNWDLAREYSSFSTDVSHNVQGNIPTVGVPGQLLVKWIVRVLAVGLWLSSAIVLAVRWRRGQPYWSLAVLAFSPMVLPLVQSYGNEVVYRVFLYSLFGCALILAPVFVTAFQAEVRWQYVTAIITLLAGTAVSAQGYTGSWYANVMPKAQVDTARIVLDQAELPAYLTAVAPVWPERASWRYVDYARFNRGYDELMVGAPYLAHRHFDNDADYDEFIEALNGRPDASTYLIMTDQMRFYSWYYGILPWDALPNLKQRLYQDTKTWAPFYDGQGITVFVHTVDTSARLTGDHP